MANTGRFELYSIDRWRTFAAATVFCSTMGGLYVEILQNKSHSLPWVALGCALAGLLGAFFVVFFGKKLRVHWLGHINEVPVWWAAPVALLVSGWLWDFRHGLVLSHQWPTYSSFALGMIMGLVKSGWQSNWNIKFPQMSVPASGLPLANKKKIKRKTTTQDLPALIRDLVIALNNRYDMTDRQKKFVEDNLLAAVNGLIVAGRIDKAAQLCRKVPSNWLRFESAFEGLEIADGLSLAAASFRINDWGTALRLFDWALASQPNPSLEKRILAAATAVAEQIRILDDTFDAKVVALQLSPRLRQILKT